MNLLPLRFAIVLAALFSSSALLPAQINILPAGEVTPAIRQALTTLAARVRGNREALLRLRPSAGQILRIAATAEDAKLLTIYVEKVFSSLPAGGILLGPRQTEIQVAAGLSSGYADAAAHFRPGITIYAVKYSAPGDILGAGIDGFIPMDGVWVMSPSAWQAFSNR